MKEQTLMEIKNNVETVGVVIQQMTKEINFLKDLAIGNHELAKLLPGYEEALEKLKNSIKDTSATVDQAAKLGEE